MRVRRYRKRYTLRINKCSNFIKYDTLETRNSCGFLFSDTEWEAMWLGVVLVLTRTKATIRPSFLARCYSGRVHPWIAVSALGSAVQIRSSSLLTLALCDEPEPVSEAQFMNSYIGRYREEKSMQRFVTLAVCVVGIISAIGLVAVAQYLGIVLE